MLKDISSMANHPSDGKKYIVIGVKEKDGMASEFFDVDNLIDQAQYQQFIENNINPKIDFEYNTFKYENYKLAYFVINNSNERPYLFSKNIQNPETHKTEYLLGDGYIRSGTSTRKMERSDFELIYANRYKNIDRKSDLIIKPFLKQYGNSRFGNNNCYLFDLSIKNIFNKSITFDIEVKIYFNEGYRVMKLFDYERSKKTTNNYKFDYRAPEFDSTLLNISFSIDHECDVIKRNRMRNEKGAIKIPQNDEIVNVFLEEIVIFKREPTVLFAEVIIRSDDFLDGSLRKGMSFEL